MASELRPGLMTAIWSKVATEATVRGRLALAPVADAAVRQAKTNASNGRHARGTPSPARPGTGPAIVSRTLVGSLTRTAVTRAGVGDWWVRVGTAPGKLPPYGRTPSSLYGLYLETGRLRNGAAYPFLLPAAQFAAKIVAPQVFTRQFGTAWRRVV